MLEWDSITEDVTGESTHWLNLLSLVSTRGDRTHPFVLWL